ncbi:MAG: exo-beta-N-acetylmuramidase NamZ domain-containing protein [Candidatus Cryptobacteroides sp.]
MGVNDFFRVYAGASGSRVRILRAYTAALVFLCAGFALNAQVKTGLEVLRDRDFDILQGRRVGLVTNPSGVDRELRSTVDIFYDSPQVNLVALYAPEHGVRGDKYAGAMVGDETDPRTGLPVYSLHGATRKPTPEMLRGVDVVVYDIQDVGVRSYTFISTLGLVMEACSEQGVEVVVLDRPNPLGGNKVEGPLVRDGFHSFISQYKIPYIYGMTVGELALMLNSEGLNCGQKGNQAPSVCRLTVVPMDGWTRDMLYYGTGLPWVLPSPNIPFCDTPQYYASAGIAGEISGLLQIGIGYTLPFQVFAAEWIDAQALKAELDSYCLPGVAFRTIFYKPFSGSQAGRLIQGVQYFFTDYESAYLTEVQFYVLQAVARLFPDHLPFTSSTKAGAFDKVCGSDYVRLTFSRNHLVSDIKSYWESDAAPFRELSSKYFLYQ